jgi:hypothetical protein
MPVWKERVKAGLWRVVAWVEAATASNTGHPHITPSAGGKTIKDGKLWVEKRQA